ncbi:hypothetical protein DV532_29565 (plasmid) [Pseudomonas sp. Leaf58]|uniref:hypothetical protein n=1 Tax=Pseudomonas sp. Leaf58 TaxID=1736226 RepID=UPI0006F5AAB6|nr:hypothetical protein [Pseudomonas sp. Leaf58]AYG48387.1 hypothetical protein DV532_29565 [Pseudomonas sp. Leaf58]KQN62066.1 hypothetical protein ASF02_07745 [Pseudomonas sp. Leaf58]
MNYISKAAGAALILLLAQHTNAQDNQFSHQRTPGHETFRYQWQDYAQQPLLLELQVTPEFSTIVTKDPKMSIRADQLGLLIFNEITALATRLSDANYAFTVTQEAAGINVQAQGQDSGELQRRLNALEQAQQHLVSRIKANTYLWISDDAEVSFNYQQMVHDALPLIKPVVQSWPRRYPAPRDQVNSYLSFLQAIPYDSLQQSTDFGVLTPAAMLAENRGDCETKQVALATFLKSTYPSMGIILIGTGDHMLLGAEMAPQAGDIVYPYKGRRFVLMDATGPARTPAGLVNDASRAHMSTDPSSIFEII